MIGCHLSKGKGFLRPGTRAIGRGVDWLRGRLGEKSGVSRVATRCDLPLYGNVVARFPLASQGFVRKASIEPQETFNRVCNVGHGPVGIGALFARAVRGASDGPVVRPQTLHADSQISVVAVSVEYAIDGLSVGGG